MYISIAPNDKAMAITPDFSNSLLTFGPTLSTLLNSNMFPISLESSTLIFSIKFSSIDCFFSNLTT